jgi:hypothetical protein
MIGLRRIGQTLLVTGLAFFSASAGHAQIGTSPPISPWLNLYQKQGGPVDNYHMFVQPQLQLQGALQQQQADLQRQTAGLATLGQQVSQMELNANRGMAPTGVGAGFMTQAPYFNVHTSRGPLAPRGGRSPMAAHTGSLGMGGGMGAGMGAY